MSSPPSSVLSGGSDALPTIVRRSSPRATLTCRMPCVRSDRAGHPRGRPGDSTAAWLPGPLSRQETTGPPRFLGSPLVPLPCSKDPGRAALTTATEQKRSRPRYIQHEGRSINHLFEVGSHSFGTRCLRFQLRFPYTGKTRFRSGSSPYRVGFEPTGLQRRISIRLRFA